MKRVAWSNVLAVLCALWLGASCAGDCPELEAQELDSLPQLAFMGLEPVVPNALIRGIWYEVQACLYRWDATPDAVRWGVASAIIDVHGRRLLWGVVANVHWSEGTSLTIVLDRLVRDNARVLSHEIVHVQGDVSDGDWRLNACVMDRDGPYVLPERPLTDAEIRELLGIPHPA